MPSVAIAKPFRDTSGAPGELAHALARVEASELRGDPFPHAIVRDFLPPALFSELRGTLPAIRDAMQSVQARHRNPGYSDKRFSYCLPIPTDPAVATLAEPVRTLQRVLTSARMVSALLARFESVVAPRLVEYERRTGQPHVPIGTSIELIHDGSGFDLPPHTDGGNKLVTGLLYFADPGDPVELGTQLYAPLDPEPADVGGGVRARDQLRVAGQAPYEPNVMLWFARSDRSFHGVEASSSSTPRRLVQYSIHLA